jgi:hypothetical protein
LGIKYFRKIDFPNVTCNQIGESEVECASHCRDKLMI